MIKEHEQIRELKDEIDKLRSDWYRSASQWQLKFLRLEKEKLDLLKDLDSIRDILNKWSRN